jgi:alginate O-acetyltransferase complex protein AlgI
VVFASPTFLFLFLPLFLLGYYLLPFRYRSGWILGGSWLFYGWWRVDFLLLLVVASTGAGVVGRQISRCETPGGKRAWLIGGVGSALALLGYFKYFNFGVASLRRILEVLTGSEQLLRGVPEVVLPVGISFFIFQIISYIVDVYRGTAPEAKSLVDVAAYVSLFPQLVAGPIVRYAEIADQLRGREHSKELFAAGTRRFALGMVRKVLVADAVAPLVDAVFALPDPGAAAAWIGLTAYTVQIYFDFSAYSDMAIGLGAMMGFHFPENFRAPYQSRSITEFWRRWHITLSAWLRDYLYIPLGGNRRGSLPNPRQSDDGDGSRRPVARRGVDLCLLGRVARWLADPRATVPGPTVPAGPRVCSRRCNGGVGLLPRRFLWCGDSYDPGPRGAARVGPRQGGDLADTAGIHGGPPRGSRSCHRRTRGV